MRGERWQGQGGLKFCRNILNYCLVWVGLSYLDFHHNGWGMKTYLQWESPDTAFARKFPLSDLYSRVYL